MDVPGQGRTLALAMAMVVATGAVLLVMGRVPICACGYVKLWHPAASSPETSQHVADPYTFSHVLHGLVFYALLWRVAPGMSLGRRFLLAVGLEAGWELIENSSLVIERYRSQTMALNYYGDSVVNSLADILAMAAGFVLARLAPVWLSVVLFFGIEIAMVLLFRDNLTLNVLMLLYPLEGIKAWQQSI
jgi:hypothetical protein